MLHKNNQCLLNKLMNYLIIIYDNKIEKKYNIYSVMLK